MLKVGHTVNRPGRKPGDPPIAIPVPEELETVPGIPTNQREVDWYAREYPLEAFNSIIERASTDWYRGIQGANKQDREYFKEHQKIYRPMLTAANQSGDLPPTGKATGEDVSEQIKTRARELGFVEVGITAYDHHYSFHSSRDWVKYDHAVCLAYAQDYELTQAIPSVAAEVARTGTNLSKGKASLELGNFIRSLGYHAQVHNAEGKGSVSIPMFVNAGLGQLGACGYLLTPHEGSRVRLTMVTTDAKVTYDQPVDYGIHAFCQVCQVCVNRCPGRALMRDKIWWRGVEKNKLYFKRCRPLMAHYTHCSVCMKVCPIQKYGMKSVMEHYAATGQVLGKGTHDLEGFTLEDKGYFGPGEMPSFDHGFFDMPRGSSDEWAFARLKQKVVVAGGKVSDEVLEEFKRDLTVALARGQNNIIE